MSTCTVTVTADGTKCGAPAVITFGGRDGNQYCECTLHALATVEASKGAELVEHPPTRTTRPFVLVRGDRIVGYAQTDSEAVKARASRLEARVVRVHRP